MLHAMQGAPHLPPFSHTNFLESLAQHMFPSILIERFGSQVFSHAQEVYAPLYRQQGVLCILSNCSVFRTRTASLLECNKAWTTIRSMTCAGHYHSFLQALLGVTQLCRLV